jgi:hypothetical protein
MTVSIDISEVSAKLAALHANEAHRADKAHRSIAIVVPLADGRCDVVREFIEEGPPFEPGRIGLESHKVFLTDREVVFVFETEEGVQALERILAEPELWDLVSSWEHCLSEEPRLATPVYEWPAHHGGHEPQGDER